MSGARRKAASTSATSTARARAAMRVWRLSLPAMAIARGEEYARRHGISLSKLVGNFLSALPLDEGTEGGLSPAVRRLYGVAAGARDRAVPGADDYRQHLYRKHTGDQG